MGLYRKKPIVVKAFQMTKKRRWNNSEWPDWLNQAWNEEPGEGGMWSAPGGPLGPDRKPTCSLVCGTLEGVHRIDWDDWIIQGVKGELYPCKPDIFEATYEAVEERKPIQCSRCGHEMVVVNQTGLCPDCGHQVLEAFERHAQDAQDDGIPAIEDADGPRSGTVDTDHFRRASLASPDIGFHELYKEINRLNAILDRVPKTADGIPAYLGMEVWFYNSHATVRRIYDGGEYGPCATVEDEQGPQGFVPLKHAYSKAPETPEPRGVQVLNQNAGRAAI